MKKLIVILVLFVVLLTACKKADIQNAPGVYTPSDVQTTVEAVNGSNSQPNVVTDPNYEYTMSYIAYDTIEYNQVFRFIDKEYNMLCYVTSQNYTENTGGIYCVPLPSKQ